MDILFDEATNDIIIRDGEIQLTSLNSEELRQRILIRLNTFMGEWELNPTFGIPYRQTIFQKVRNREQVDVIFINEVNSVPGVDSITEFLSEYDTINRRYRIVRLIVTTTEGTQVRITENNPDNIEYPTPTEQLTFICEL